MKSLTRKIVKLTLAAVKVAVIAAVISGLAFNPAAIVIAAVAVTVYEVVLS